MARERVEVAADLLNTRLPWRSPFQARTSAKSHDDGLLEHVVAATEATHLLGGRGDLDRPVAVVPPRQAAVGDLGADAGRGVEGRDAGPAGPQPLGEGALRRQLDLELAAEVLAGELLVLADVGGHHPADAARGEQATEAPVVDATVVRHDLEVADPGLEHRLDQHRRDAGDTEPAGGDRRPAPDVGHGIRGRPDNFVHEFVSFSSLEAGDQEDPGQGDAADEERADGRDDHDGAAALGE